MSASAAEAARTRSLRQIAGVRELGAERALIEARRRQVEAEAACVRIESRMGALLSDEARCAPGASSLSNLAVLQAAQRLAEQLRAQRRLQQKHLALARLHVAQCRGEREQAAARWRKEQGRRDRLDRMQREARQRCAARRADADDETAVESGAALRAAAGGGR